MHRIFKRIETLALLPCAVFLSSDIVTAQDDGPEWLFDHSRICEFPVQSGQARPQACDAYFRKLEVEAEDGRSYRVSEHSWRGEDGRVISYRATTGVLGVSEFTIGRFTDSLANDRVGATAVSYSPDRETLIIGVPNEGISFVTYTQKAKTTR